MATLVAFCSCSNENGIEDMPDTEMVQVNFNVKALDVDVQPMNSPMLRSSSTRADASSVLTIINYYLKNTVTGKIYSGEQRISDVGSSEFGNISLWIPTGTYQLVFFGYGTDNSAGTATMYVEKDYNRAMINLKNKDSFYLKTEKTIGAENDRVEINLSRLNSKLVVKLNDAVPSDIKKVKVKMSYYPVFNTQNETVTHEGSSGIASVMESYLTIENGNVNEFGFYLLPQSGRTLTLSVYDESNNELGACSITVSFYRNKKTIVEGNLFDVITQKPFVVTVSDEWDEDVIVPIQ
ncbi:fimbrillin family protein [Bacteroides sp. 214]|uniref:fimbrillin family protein n=1 Tax=Bacteroides sp. 214 TaxID=2302935 RepID=UPI0013D73268|nr:fimbrillin family protein [Bacteroides sp. 214]